jgi:hypothetical protein
MGIIHINRNRENLGKFDEQEVADGLKSGRFLPADLAWREPMATWEPLSTFTDLPEPSEQIVVEVKEEPLPAIPEPAWERSESSLSPSAALETIRQVLFSPKETFQKMTTTGGYSKPLVFYTLMAWFSGIASVGYQAVAGMVNPTIFGEIGKNLSTMTIVIIACAVALILPIFLIFGSFFSAAMFHLSLLVVGGANKPFEVTYRAFAYATGALAVLQFIPLCGGYLSSLAGLFYMVIALREAQQTETWRIVLGSLILFLVCCGAVVAFSFAVVGMTGGYFTK